MDYDVIRRGSAQDLFDEQYDVRQLLRRQQQQEEEGQGTTEWVIISTGIFLSFLFKDAFGVVERFDEGATGSSVEEGARGYGAEVSGCVCGGEGGGVG